MLNNIKKRMTVSKFIMMALAFVVTLMLGSTYWSIMATRENVDQAVNRLSTFYLEELVGTRKLTLKNSLDQNFQQLNRILELLKTKKIQNQQELRTFLADVQTISDVNKLALVDENNIVYTAHSTTSDAGRYAFLQEELTEAKIVTSNIYGAKKQVVLAVPVQGIQMNGKKLVAGFIQLDIDAVVGSLNRDTKTGADKTAIGLYHKNGDDLTTSSFSDIEVGTNLLQHISKTELKEGQSFKDVEQSFHNMQSGSVTIDHNGHTEYIHYAPVEGTDWMLTVLVHDNTIADQLEYTSSMMLRRNILQLLITAILIVIVFVGVISMYKRNNDMERKQQELEAKAKEEALLQQASQAANQAKTNFLFNMSHDIRTPMNAILGFAKIMEKELGEPEKLSKHLKKLQESGEYLLSIINNVLDMARIESGKVELNLETVDLEKGFNDFLEMFSEDLNRKNLHFSKSLKISNRYVLADKQKLQQITANLLSNAIKYTPEGGKVFVGLQELSCTEEDSATYELIISDTGIGMTKEFQDHIFEAFTREHTSTENKIIGTGLGMAIVKHLIDLQGGSINLTSKPNQGTTFNVVLTYQLTEAPAEEKVETADSTEFDFKGKRVLLAEDNDINAEIAVELLEDTGLVVERAQDGVVCLELLEKAEPGYYDLVLMDIQMPNMDGYMATKKIREMADPQKAGIPIIAMTANAFEEDKQRAYKCGMNGFAAKPIDLKALLATMKDILA